MSDESFNPYHEWLGLDQSVRRPNHYQLLGLDQAEQSVQRIAEAASRAMAKVRSCRPGDRGAQWAQLLEQLTTAATCLTDPGRRAEYDRQLGGGSAAARAYNRPAPRSRVVPAAGGTSAALPMQAPQGISAAYSQGTRGPGGALDPMAPVVPAGPAGAAPAYGQTPGYGPSQAHPVSATPVYPGSSGYPVSGASGPVAPAAGGYGYPSAAQGRIPAGIPVGRPVAAVPVGRPVAPVSAAAAPLPGKGRSVASKVRSRARNSYLVLLAACFGVGMLLLAGAFVVTILNQKSDGRGRPGDGPIVWSQPIAPAPSPKSQTFRPPSPPQPARPVAPAPDTVVPTPQAPVGSPEALVPEAGGPPPTAIPEPPVAATDLPPLPADPTPANTETLAEPSFSQPGRNLPPASLPGGMPEAKSVPDATLSLPTFPGAPTLGPLDKAAPQPPSPKSQPVLPDTNPKPSLPAEPTRMEPVPTDPTPTKPASGAASVKPEETAALAKTLKTAHAAILAGKYDAALVELDKVRFLPKLPEHHAKYERLTLMAGYAKEFQSALKAAVAALQSGDEIEVGSSTVVGFVSAAEDSITLRVTGANRTYAMDSLPVGLAVALADRWLKKDDPVSLVIKGAFVASVHGIDDERRAKARQWLEEASKKGVEGELHKVLDDTYDLEKDLK